MNLPEVESQKYSMPVCACDECMLGNTGLSLTVLCFFESTSDRDNSLRLALLMDEKHTVPCYLASGCATLEAV